MFAAEVLFTEVDDGVSVWLTVATAVTVVPLSFRGSESPGTSVNVPVSVYVTVCAESRAVAASSIAMAIKNFQEERTYGLIVPAFPFANVINSRLV